jgi:hypothetical protein
MRVREAVAEQRLQARGPVQDVPLPGSGGSVKAIREAGVVAAGLVLLALDSVIDLLTPEEERAGRRLAAECGAVWWEDVPSRVSADEVRALLAMPRARA